MIAHNKRQLLNTQDSYYYRQQRSRFRKRWLIRLCALCCLVAVLAAVSFMVKASPSQSNIASAMLEESQSHQVNNNGLVHGPQLLLDHPNPNMRAALPLDIRAKVEINGLLAFVEIEQEFINPHAVALNGVYQFPLPENGAVQYMKIKVADKEIIGSIMEKQAAKRRFEQAKKSGKKASLVEQQRANLFTNKVANIPPQSKVVVTLKVLMPIDFHQGQFNLRLPLAMTSRYSPKLYQPSPAEIGSELLYADDKRMEKILAKSQAAVTISLNAGAPIKNITSPSHVIASQQQSSQSTDNLAANYLITTAKEQINVDKSFVLSWQLGATSQPIVSSFTQQVGGDYFTLLTLFPPQQEQVSDAQSIARDIIFIIDTSGSMQGQSMEQAKASLKRAIMQLSAKDSFNIIAFDNTSQSLFSRSKMVNSEGISQAINFIDGLVADGGTEMYRPLSQALMMPSSKQQDINAVRQIIFITDGAVSNEFELMQLITDAQQNFRLYTVGIGAAPNGYFMRKAAQFGRGSFVFIQNTDEVLAKTSSLMRKISHPVLTDIELLFDEQIHGISRGAGSDLEIFPKKIPDLHLGEPLQVTIRSKQPITSLQLQARNGLISASQKHQPEDYYQQLIIDDRKGAQGIATLWARRKIEDLLDSLVTGANAMTVKQQVIETSLQHQIISPYTSFIAIEQEISLKPQDQLPQNKQQEKAAKRKAQFIAKQSQRVAMPQTALGWQQQLIWGVIFLLLSLAIRYFAINKATKKHA